jgi:ABC-2 type transport system permease protein
MRILNLKAIYILWLREMKIFTRAKSRILGNVLTPLIILGALGTGLRGATIPGIPANIGYLQFLIPGMVGTTMIFSSTFAGMSVLWDRQFGFLKEIMVTPVSRVSIVLGRMTGGTTTAVIQGIAILLISIIVGFRVLGVVSVLVSIILMIMMSAAFIGLGLAIASRLRDTQGFGMIMNLIMLPVLFLSGAYYPLNNMPSVIIYASYLNPLTYGVDGMRGALIGVSAFPVALDMGVLLAFCIFMVLLGTYLFEKNESV